jgi:hypothetical protein
MSLETGTAQDHESNIRGERGSRMKVAIIGGVWGSIKTSGVDLELRTLAQRHAATAR